MTGEPLREKHTTVEMLLQRGVDPNITNSDRLPIHVAVSLSEIRYGFCGLTHQAFVLKFCRSKTKVEARVNFCRLRRQTASNVISL